MGRFQMLAVKERLEQLEKLMKTMNCMIMNYKIANSRMNILKLSSTQKKFKENKAKCYIALTQEVD